LVGHDQDHVAEVHLLAERVGSDAVVHDLQQDVVDVRVRLLDLVEQDDRVLVLVHRVGEQAALVVADVARRGADEPRDGVALHVLAHVEAQELDAQGGGELLGHLGLAHARRAGEQVGADRLLRIAQARRGPSSWRRELDDGVVLAEHGALQVGL
jgi:hypothetical protein